MRPLRAFDDEPAGVDVGLGHARRQIAATEPAQLCIEFDRRITHREYLLAGQDTDRNTVALRDAVSHGDGAMLPDEIIGQRFRRFGQRVVWCNGKNEFERANRSVA